MTPPPPPQVSARGARGNTPNVPTVPPVPTTPFSWHQLMGAFQCTIVVSTKDQLLYPEERLLAWLKWRLQVAPTTSRWYPVLQRYLSLIEGRVSGFGGNPGNIPPSPVGDVPGRQPHPPGHPVHGDRRREFTGKVIGVGYNRFGDFDGFTLLTLDGHEHWFRGRESEMAELIESAWRERTLISVFVEPHETDWPASVVLRRWR